MRSCSFLVALDTSALAIACAGPFASGAPADDARRQSPCASRTPRQAA